MRLCYSPLTLAILIAVVIYVSVIPPPSFPHLPFFLDVSHLASESCMSRSRISHSLQPDSSCASTASASASAAARQITLGLLLHMTPLSWPHPRCHHPLLRHSFPFNLTAILVMCKAWALPNRALSWDSPSSSLWSIKSVSSNLKLEDNSRMIKSNFIVSPVGINSWAANLNLDRSRLLWRIFRSFPAGPILLESDVQLRTARGVFISASVEIHKTTQWWSIALRTGR